MFYALHLVHQFDLSCLNSLWWSTDISIVKKRAIDDIGFDQGMKVALKFNSSIPGCDNPWWTTAAGGNVGLFVTNGISGGYAWPHNYKDGSTAHTFMSFIMGDNAKELSELADDLIVKQILQDLDSMFGKTPASTCFGVINHNNYVIQNWGKSPYTRGAYSFHTPTTVKVKIIARFVIDNFSNSVSLSHIHSRICPQLTTTELHLKETLVRVFNSLFKMAVSSLPVKQQVYLGRQQSQELFLRANELEMRVSDGTFSWYIFYVYFFPSGLRCVNS